MNIPRFWAEARLQRPRSRDQGQITVRRWGWSRHSQAEAEEMARRRTAEALARIARGETLDRREIKHPYHGAEGVPIREEIVQERGPMVVTRNSYGARCLNVENVLFADVDFAEEAPMGAGCLSAIWSLVALLMFGTWGVRGVDLGLRVLVVGFGVFLVIRLWRFLDRKLRKTSEESALGRLEKWLVNHPDWRLRVYRSPAGFRLLATHRTFEPGDPEVASFFQAMRVDKAYAAMCRHQQCFRARLSAKPWRIGIEHHLRPRPGIWPISPERLPERESWVRAYEARARDFAACRFVEEFGHGPISPAAATVQRFHDDECRALSSLPIA